MKRRDMLLSTPFAASILSCSGSSDNPLDSAGTSNAANTETSAGDTVHNGPLANGARSFGAEKTAAQPLDPDMSYQMVLRDYDNYLYEFNRIDDLSIYSIGLRGRMRYKFRDKVYESDAYAFFYKGEDRILIRAMDPHYNTEFTVSSPFKDFINPGMSRALIMYDDLKLYFPLSLGVLKNDV